MCEYVYIYIYIHMYENTNIIKHRPSSWSKATPCLCRAATHCCSVVPCAAVRCIVCCSVWLLFSESPRPVLSLTFMYGLKKKLGKKKHICWKTRQHPVSSLIDSGSFYWLLFHPHHNLVSHLSFNSLKIFKVIAFHYHIHLMYFRSFWSHVLFPVSFEHQVICCSFFFFIWSPFTGFYFIHTSGAIHPPHTHHTPVSHPSLNFTWDSSDLRFIISCISLGSSPFSFTPCFEFHLRIKLFVFHYFNLFQAFLVALK